eukprot:scaffold304932_cov17-Tisochrysis_lutea.AAC.1
MQSIAEWKEESYVSVLGLVTRNPHAAHLQKSTSTCTGSSFEIPPPGASPESFHDLPPPSPLRRFSQVAAFFPEWKLRASAYLSHPQSHKAKQLNLSELSENLGNASSQRGGGGDSRLF